MMYLYLHITLTIVYKTVNVYSFIVDRQSDSCMVSLVVPQESIKTVCNRDNGYTVDQKMKSVDRQLSSFRRDINNLNARLAYNLARNAKYETSISEQILHCKENVANLHKNIISTRIRNDKKIRHKKMTPRGPAIKTNESDLAEYQILTKGITRALRNLLRKEVRRIKASKKINEFLRNIEFNLNLQDVKNYKYERNKEIVTEADRNKFVTKKSATGTKILSENQTEYMQADAKRESDCKISGCINTDLRIQNDHKMQYKARFEEIEHDIETLANGLTSLHENMFEIEDIKKQFEIEKIDMENAILLNVRKEHRLLDMKFEYLENQTKLISKLLQATVNSQKQVQASVQKFNDTYKLRNLEIEKDIAKLSTQIDTLNGTVNPSYIDALSFDNTMAILDLEDTVAFVKELKQIWPTVQDDMATTRANQDKLFSIVNSNTVRNENYTGRKDKKEKKVMMVQELISAEDTDRTNTGKKFGPFALTVLVLVLIQSFV